MAEEPNWTAIANDLARKLDAALEEARALAVAVLMECDGLGVCWTAVGPENPLREPVRASETRLKQLAEGVLARSVLVSGEREEQ